MRIRFLKITIQRAQDLVADPQRDLDTSLRMLQVEEVRRAELAPVSAPLSVPDGYVPISLSYMSQNDDPKACPRPQLCGTHNCVAGGCAVPDSVREVLI